MSQPANALAGVVGTSTVPSFGALRAVVRTGAGIVARFPGLVLVTAADGAGVERLLEICGEVSAVRSRAPGKVVARRLAGWLADVDDPVNFGVVAATDDALAVFLCGHARLLVPGEPALSGTQAAAWVDRLIPWPCAHFLLTIGGSDVDSAEPARGLQAFLDLRSGVVPGEGLLLVPSDTQPVVSALADPAPVEQPRPVLEPPPRAELIEGAPPEGAPREPLPAGPAASQSTPQPEIVGVHVQGYLCSRGHLNDPRALFCASCGIRMAERTGVLVEGVRPPLGLLVFDDGGSFVLDEDYLLGRQPDVDERVREGVLRPLIIDDDKRLVSRAHLEITLKGWDVYITDTGTANGTLIATSATQASTALVPGQPLRLPPGARVSIGKRSFVFESSLAR